MGLAGQANLLADSWKRLHSYTPILARSPECVHGNNAL